MALQWVPYLCAGLVVFGLASHLLSWIVAHRTGAKVQLRISKVGMLYTFAFEMRCSRCRCEASGSACFVYRCSAIVCQRCCGPHSRFRHDTHTRRDQRMLSVPHICSCLYWVPTVCKDASGSGPGITARCSCGAELTAAQNWGAPPNTTTHFFTSVSRGRESVVATMHADRVVDKDGPSMAFDVCAACEVTVGKHIASGRRCDF